jgi:hypothetical protein
MDDRQANALLQASKSTAAFLGKESEFHEFAEYIRWSEKAEPKPSVEQIAANNSSWIQLLSPPLRKLYSTGYRNEDAQKIG